MIGGLMVIAMGVIYFIILMFIDGWAEILRPVYLPMWAFILVGVPIALGGYLGRRNRNWGLLSIIASLPLLGLGLHPVPGAALGFVGGIIMQRDWVQHGSWLAIIGGLMTVARDLFLNIYFRSGGGLIFQYDNLLFCGILLSGVMVLLGGYIGRRKMGLGAWISVSASLPLLIISILSIIPKTESLFPDALLILGWPPDVGSVLGIAGGIILLKQSAQI